MTESSERIHRFSLVGLGILPLRRPHLRNGGVLQTVLRRLAHG